MSQNSKRSMVVYLLLACLAGWQATLARAQGEKLIPFYIGTYTGGSSQGIYRSELNASSGELSGPELVAELANPSFLAIHPRLDVLYAVSEVSRGEGRDQSQVMAYAIQQDGKLRILNGSPSGGDGPCYVSTDAAGQFVFVANYGSGSIAAIQLGADGRLSQTTSTVQHSGSSINPQRQQAPHAHCILADPSDQYVCAVDLGLDQVVVYRLDRSSGKLTATDSPLKTQAGNGPRHLAFHPDGKHAFVIHEITSKLTSCSWDSASGQFRELKTVSTLPPQYSGKSSTAEVLVHPSGRFVYGSNRGHNSISVFAFDAGSGSLNALSHASTDGKIPRNFRIDPTGAYLLAENQGSDSIVAFRIDPQSGELARVGKPLSVGSPCCIKFHSR